MKRYSYIILGVLAVLTTQCKKEPTLIIPEAVSENIHITLDVVNDSKVSVNTNNGKVDFEMHDEIYVGSNGKYVGKLTYLGTKFTGTISGATQNEKLHFFFLGNKTPVGTLTQGTTTSCTVSIVDQSSGFPVISYGTSTENFSTSVTNYSAYLRNQCALVKFDVTTSSTEATCITGFKNKVTVNFSGTFTTEKVGEGVINLGSGSGEKWAILFMQDELTAGEPGSAYASDGSYIGTRGTVPAIKRNDFLTDGIAVNVDTDNKGKLPGRFSVSSDKQIQFSKGNLQYIGSVSPPYWKFADNQYDRLGDTGQGTDNTGANRDLFGYGTSGYTYYPYSTSKNQSDYAQVDIAGTQHDWGVYNAISNGGNQANLWRTLTKDEWSYLLVSRSGSRLVKAKVFGVEGAILLPDDWDNSLYQLYSINQNSADYTSNEITLDVWKNSLEAMGAVFLPSAYRREGTKIVDNGATFVTGNYWSSNYDSAQGVQAYRGVYMAPGWLWPSPTSDPQLGPIVNGFSVRLVCDVN